MSKERKYELLGEELREVREASGIRQSVMARKLGMHQTTLKNYEEGRSQIGHHDYRRFMRACAEQTDQQEGQGERLVDQLNHLFAKPLKLLFAHK